MKRLILCLVALILMLLAGPVLAGGNSGFRHHGHHFHGQHFKGHHFKGHHFKGHHFRHHHFGRHLHGFSGHRHFHRRFGIGVVIAAPLFYPGYAYPPLRETIIYEAQPVYIPPAASSVEYWYYCRESDAYHPHVKECPGGWERVPATPSGGGY